MAANLIIYADHARQLQTSGSLIVFGIEKLRRAKIVQQLALLEKWKIIADSKIPYDPIPFVNEFVWEFLIDCVRILIFFEGYMKAELIIRNFCVHTINKEGQFAHMSALANQQKRRPIDLDEIQAIEPFITNVADDTVDHPGLKETTLSINILLGRKYLSYYQFDDDLVDDIRYFNDIRNRLHFNAGAEFPLSEQLINRVKRVNQFVDDTLNRWIKKKDTPS